MKNRVKEKKVEKESRGGNFQKGVAAILNGTFLTRERVLGNMPFILFASFLMICYISYGYYTERTVRDLQQTDRELKELRSEYITVRSKLEQTEQQSQVAQDIGALGLKETREPPRKVRADMELVQNSRYDAAE